MNERERNQAIRTIAIAAGQKAGFIDLPWAIRDAIRLTSEFSTEEVVRAIGVLTGSPMGRACLIPADPFAEGVRRDRAIYLVCFTERCGQPPEKIDRLELDRLEDRILGTRCPTCRMDRALMTWGA